MPHPPPARPDPDAPQPPQASVFLPPPPGPRWIGNLAYVQFTVSLAATLFGTSALTEAGSRSTDPDFGSLPLGLAYTGLMLLLTVASLLSAVLMKRRTARVRTLAVAVQLAHVGSLAVTVLLLVEANVTAGLILLAQALATAVLAPAALILLSRPATVEWYSRPG